MNIIGVDFSGAMSDQNTWMAQGIFDGNTLDLTDCHPISRAALADLLKESRSPTVAALDFPFAVPQSFAQFWCPEARTMTDLWAAAAGLEMDGFMDLRDRFVAEQGETKRLADTFFPECYSCLHKANPNMVPMTFRGMQMLHGLWALGCEVPPLADSGRNKTVLLEAMPGAALRAFGLPFKGYKTSNRSLERRRLILDQLSQQSSVNLAGLDRLRDMALVNHDCLDSIVAAVVASLWTRDPSLFRCPAIKDSLEYDPVVMLEGWLYAPVFINRTR